MKKLIVAAALALLAGPVFAEGEFAEGSQAKSWGLLGEENALFEAKVVDVLCEVSGDCPENCGDGRRYLGLLRTADNALIYVNKNLQGVFTGGVEDLLPYCGQTVEVDGLLVGDAAFTPTKVFQVQTIRLPGGEWEKANRWTKVWDEEYPAEAAVKGRWYRKDPRVTAQLDQDGYLGLGAEADEAFIEYYFSN